MLTSVVNTMLRHSATLPVLSKMSHWYYYFPSSSVMNLHHKIDLELRDPHLETLKMPFMMLKSRPDLANTYGGLIIMALIF